MMPGEFPLDIYRGDTARYQFKLWTDTGKTQPADLTGVTVAAMVRDKTSGGNYYADLQVTVTQPNIIDMFIPTTLSKEFPSKGVWDLQLTYTNGDVITVLKGPVAVTPDVTYTTVAPLKAAS
jgi:hypothetical protein